MTTQASTSSPFVTTPMNSPFMVSQPTVSAFATNNPFATVSQPTFQQTQASPFGGNPFLAAQQKQQQEQQQQSLTQSHPSLPQQIQQPFQTQPPTQQPPQTQTLTSSQTQVPIQSQTQSQSQTQPPLASPPLILPPSPSIPNTPFITEELMSIPGTPLPPPPPILAPMPEVSETVRIITDLNSENLESLKQRIRDLEAQIRDTEAEIRDQKGSNAELRQLLTDRASGLASVQTAMVDRLEQQRQEHTQTNEMLKNELTMLMGQYQRDKLNLLLEQIDFSKEGIEEHRIRFDSPEYMGNRGVSTGDLQRAASQLRDNFSNLLSTLQRGGDIVGISRNISDWTNKFLDDSKGAMNKVNDPDHKLAIMTGSDGVARKVMDMLTHASQLVPQGIPDEGQLQFLLSEEVHFISNMELVMDTVVANSESLGELSQHQNDLEKTAEQELQKAQNSIQLITNQLREVTPNCTGPQQNIARSILDASVAITCATGLLVGAATHSQTERLKQLDAGLAVQRDPLLTEGLLVAAKTVSESTRDLAYSAFESMQGQIDDQALISASRSVAAATAQLVGATRAGASGEGSETLDKAADAVTRATRTLVESARLLTNAEELAFVEKTNFASVQVEEEIEKAAEILRMQKELEEAERKLQRMKHARGGNTNVGSFGKA
eukprot:TRINITY_DN13969_c0_g2_i4.p1 TRINITY_DN13969_c0_g2~~TRINITY_DN13969_c0_g2_i4.p1  ORF type:complete len:670 (+),score=194.91 TRINITY_DN13969_c0_g2_i4:24-2012(+)